MKVDRTFLKENKGVPQKIAVNEFNTIRLHCRKQEKMLSWLSWLKDSRVKTRHAMYHIATELKDHTANVNKNKRNKTGNQHFIEEHKRCPCKNGRQPAAIRCIRTMTEESIS